MSHTLVLKRGQHPQSAIKTFGLDNLKELHQHIVNNAFSKEVDIKADTLHNIKKALNHESKEALKTAFYHLEKEHFDILNCNEKLAPEAVKNLALTLPAGDRIKPMNETDLKVNYPNTILSPFINKDMHLLKYPEVDPKEKSQQRRNPLQDQSINAWKQS
ncbi:hypothetical protein MUCCIDRAFT_166508 [Mucor lusitanicus CBS 277.49]|uniref:Uncharacterized protein n=2 Tax=Mucor circinelloides f. lusitanicus TaxID=29924 RepID=A0A168HQD6_MUCCL|nr:hypothetical protein MUCCIDRAFT_166508 [Mucor lusitanicus CBS 277.49]